MLNKFLINLLALGLMLATSTAFAHEHKHEKGHQHHHVSEKALQASKGVFDDKDVKDRTLSDWDGTWQSIYGYLAAGDLDVVLKTKAEKNKDKTVEEYKAYYTKGYKTDVEWIGIEDNTLYFHKKDAVASGTYSYAGYKILTYKSGKKGVRYLFTNRDKLSKAPKYIQFSDHIIEPTKAEHFHIYMGNESHAKLLTEMENWPTYYPLSLSKDEIIEEMLHH